MKIFNLTLFFLLISTIVDGQDFSALEYRNLGPYRGGRVTAVAGIASQPATFYLGATGAGVWKTTDYGTSWKNVSDGFFSTPSIGAIAVAQNDPNVVYVGTGSDGLRSNVIQGRGMYKSIDGGENWEVIGLENVGQIGAVRIHPLNHNIVYVAAIGNAFKANAERGVFKTTNGGKSWKKILFVSDNVGFSDIEFLPSNPETLFAAAWKAERKPWTIISGGKPEEGGIYKSLDGGETWDKANNGLPTTLIGKIDVALTPADSRIVYALVEAPGKEGGLFKSVDQGNSYELISSDNVIRTRPFYYNNLRVDPKNADVVYALATRYSKSTDGGKTWKRMTPPHGDNHDMWINPDNPNLFIQANDGGANVTHNGGETWSTQFNQPTAEIYQVEVDDQYPYWVYGGQQDNYSTVAVPSQAPYGLQAPGIGYIINTGGCETGPAVPKPGNSNIVYSNCKGRFGVFNKETGTEMQFYVGASNIYGHNPKDLKYRFQRVSPIHVSPHNPDVVYHCSQFVHKTTNDGKSWETISPDLTAFETDKQVISGSPITRDITGEEYYSTIYAIRESTLKEGLIWVGSNDGPVHVTQNGGETWENVTPSKLPPGGRVDAVEPSPHNPAKAYVSVLRYQLGDSKPYIYKTTNYGKSWQLITNGIPNDFPTRVIREDPVREGLLFAGTEYGVFVSFDDGVNWKPFQQNLPVTPITDMKIHRGDLVMSTMGRGFWVLGKIDALRQNDFSNISEATLFKPANTIRYRHPTGTRVSVTPTYPRPSAMIDYFLPNDGSVLKMEIKNEGGGVVARFLSDTAKNKLPDEVISDMSTNNVEYLINKSLKSEKGLNRFSWDMTMTGAWHKQKSRRFRNGPMVKPGTYSVELTVDGSTLTQTFEIQIDPRIESNNVSAVEIGKQVDLQLEVRDLLSEARRLEDDLSKQKKEATDEDNSKLEAALAKLKTPEGIYMQPMIVDQISYLNSMLNRADQVPGKDAYDRFEELKEMFESVKEILN
ncbi:MAG: glycosyl hydrolase [Cyclobacteriaceae bacterium]